MKDGTPGGKNSGVGCLGSLRGCANLSAGSRIKKKLLQVRSTISWRKPSLYGERASLWWTETGLGIRFDGDE